MAQPVVGHCRNCGTFVRFRDGAGWTHEESFLERRGCPQVDPIPEGVTVVIYNEHSAQIEGVE